MITDTMNNKSNGLTVLQLLKQAFKLMLVFDWPTNLITSCKQQFENQPQ